VSEEKTTWTREELEEIAKEMKLRIGGKDATVTIAPVDSLTHLTQDQIREMLQALATIPSGEP